MSAGPADPRLFVGPARPGGRVRGLPRRLAQGDLGSLPVLLGLLAVGGYFQPQNDRFLSAANLDEPHAADRRGRHHLGRRRARAPARRDRPLRRRGERVRRRGDGGAQHPARLRRAGGHRRARSLVGAAVGALNGFWVTRFRVPAFLVTLAGLLAWQGALLRVLGRQGSINLTDDGIVDVANTFYGSTVTWTVAVVDDRARPCRLALLGRRRRAAAGLAARAGLAGRRCRSASSSPASWGWRWSSRPTAACRWRCASRSGSSSPSTSCCAAPASAVTSTPSAATSRRPGAPASGVERVRLLVFVLASTLAAMGGMLAASRSLAVSQSSGGNDVLLYAIAGAVIGGTSLFGGRGTAWSALPRRAGDRLDPQRDDAAQHRLRHALHRHRLRAARRRHDRRRVPPRSSQRRPSLSLWAGVPAQCRFPAAMALLASGRPWHPVRSRTTTDPRPTAKVVPLPGLGATHTRAGPRGRHHSWTKVHGHDVAYRQAGEGPVLVMIHGIAGSSGTWVPLMPLLAERYTVIAPDLLGHGESRQAPGRLQPRRLRLGDPRPPRRARSRAGHGRRPQPRRRHRDAVRLPVPADGRAPRARVQRRAGQGGQPAAAGPQRARHRVRAAGGAAPQLHDASVAGSAVCSVASACAPTRSSARCGAPGPASPTCGPSEPSSTRSAPSSTSPASGSAPATASTSPTRCPR